MTTVETPTPEVTLRIGGERCTAGSGGSHPHVNPSTGEAGASIPFTGNLFADLMERAGFPPVVLQIRPGAVEAGGRSSPTHS